MWRPATMRLLPQNPVQRPDGGVMSRPRRTCYHRAAFAALLLSLTSLVATAQTVERGNPHGEWRYWGADAWSTRYSPLDQINAENFGRLEVAWLWRGDNFGPQVDNLLRATPTY